MVHLSSNDNSKTISCGHDIPDKNVDHILTKPNYNGLFEEKFQIAINIQRPNEILSLNDEDKIGTWTMVYDEGFEFKIKDNIFFAFSKYEKTDGEEAKNEDTIETSGYKNICNETFLGTSYTFIV